MEIEITARLNAEQIAAIIAEKYGVPVENVTTGCVARTSGYGPSEYEYHVPTATIRLTPETLERIKQHGKP